MHLKRLDVVGFKSFADTIKLDFEPGVTAVVGPNGCGKSNIIDAIRWCLGEMSAKSLRSSAMLDVVFNGSGSRPPGNMAEVTLTFDNTDKRLPIDYSEVSISRRLFRSGESEYFINRTQCRLRDIRELFLDTGMGEDGYSSMEQGKVEWILQAKPEERRELFEEAAGVSKYRARREEALRKLERVEIDLSRLNDIIVVTQDQIRKLENAVNKAKTYERIKGELKVMEIGDWLFQLNNSDVEMAELKEKLMAAQQAHESWNTQSHQTEAELAQHRTSLAGLEEELLQANQKLNAIDSTIRIGEERIQNSKQRENDLLEQITHIEESFVRERSRLGELETQKTQQTQTLDELKGAGASIETDFAESQRIFNVSMSTLEQKKKEVKEVRDTILDRAQERSQLQQQMGRLSSDLARFISQAENLEKDKARLQADIAASESALNTTRVSVDELRNSLSDKTTALTGITEKIQKLSAAEDQAQKDLISQAEKIAKLHGRIHSIQEEQTQDAYLSGTQAILSQGFQGIAGPLGRLIQTDAADRDLISASIGEHLGDLVADTNEDAERAIQFLRESERGRARIWVLDKVSSSAMGELLGSFSSKTTLISRIQTEAKYKPLISSLCASLWIEGTTVFGKAVINGGADPAKWQTHVEHRMPELEKALVTEEERRTQLEASVQQLDQDISAAGHEREAAVKELEEARIRLQVAEADVAKISQKTQIVKEEQQVIELDLVQIQENKVRTNTEHQQVFGRFETMQSREKDDHDQLDLLQQELTEFQHQQAKASADLSAKEEKHNAFREKLRWQESVTDHTNREIANVNQTMERLVKLKADAQAQIETAVAARNEAKNMIDNALAERQTAAEVCSNIQTQRATLSENVRTGEARLSNIRSEINAAQEIIQSELIRESNLKNRTEILNQRLLDQYEMTIDAAKVEFQPQAADAETLDRLKKRVQNIGPINLAAPQEHAELSEKNTFMTTQQADLLKAKDDLKQVITKINATTKEHFKETFDKVRANFRELYSKLFQGGEADIRFTDETDILNTGIDIFCQPPGKKLLHISLLSGGEKALTAIALLFAFFQVRPSPVALMDEVDAPLDEANVLRYADMIKLFSEKSQFIIISHNKRTMEMANNLYGVTMEELGVSKVLSARLQKKEAAPVPEPAVAGA